ncbi:MAG: nitrilase-related carbon-nitrogen hydrolase, partial [Actinomycetota bacterium]
MRVAAVQLAPVFLDRAGTIDVVLDALRRAAADGAELVAFPETFVPGYPAWADFSHASFFDHPDQKATWARYLDESVDVGRGDLDPVVAAAAELGVFVYLGVVERSSSRGSVYCSLVAIHPDDGIVSVHRKLKPTYGERLMWADGDGAGLLAHDCPTADGDVRVSGLNCW